MFLGEPKQQNLLDPQSLNVYSYSTDNPITKKDPTGKQLDELVDLSQSASEEAGPIIQQSASTWEQVTTALINQTFHASQEVDSYFSRPTINEITGLPFNLKGLAGTTILSAGILKWFTDNANGGTDGPTNLDWTSILLQKLRGNGTSIYGPLVSGTPFNGSSANVQENLSTTQQAHQTYSSFYSTSPVRSNPTPPLPSNNGYGSSGSTYTNYIPANTHTACGSLCR